MARFSESALQQEILSWIKQNQYAYLATVDKKQARVRPLVMFQVEDRYYFVTFSGDSKVGQIAENKWVEVCVPLTDDGHTGYIRLSGTAIIIKNESTKAEATDWCYFFDEYFHGSDDPDFTLIEFYPDYAEFMRPGESSSQSCPLKRY
jgi:general stress protein 26